MGDVEALRYQMRTPLYASYGMHFVIEDFILEARTPNKPIVLPTKVNCFEDIRSQIINIYMLSNGVKLLLNMPTNQ
jgi:hypothetical protein